MGKLAAAAFAAGIMVATVAQAQTSRHAALGAWGVDLTAMDPSVAPGDDFFMYVNGGWYRKAVISPDRAETGTFDDLILLSEKHMQEIAESLRAKPRGQLTDEERKLRDLYDAFTDQRQINARGLAPARPDLNAIAALRTADDLAAAFGSPRLEVGGPFNIDVDVNDKDPTAYAVQLRQGGLGMPNRDYYLRDDKTLETTREAYKKHLAKMLTLVDAEDADARATRVYDLEHKIAEAQWANADRRDQDKTFNPMTVSELKAFAPDFPWDAYFKSAEIPVLKNGMERQVVVAEKSAFPVLAKIFAETPVEVWRDYMILHYIRHNAAYLPKTIDDENFAFYGTVISGRTQQLTRSTRAVQLLDGLLGEAFGKTYVAKYFPPEARTKAQALVDTLLKVYDADIRTLPWMTEETRAKALTKLHKFTPHIGYPDHWRDYAGYSVTRNDLLGDIIRGEQFDWDRRVKRIDALPDRNEWGMTPPTVNAYYTPNLNAIFFPAAILQPPFFDPNADDAVNFGAIGAVIGHEMSHGFDDQGSKFDGDGAYANWWTPEDRKAFEALTTKLGKQYDSYEPLPGLHINGAFTMGENIADLSGLSIALKAYHLSLGGKPAPVLDGFTGDQRLFLSFGQIWRQKSREGALRQRILANSHAPSSFRAIGPERNIDGWYDAFPIKPTDRYYLAPDDRVHLW